MYLSRLELNPQVKEVKRDLASIYEMHSTLIRAFKNTADSENSGDKNSERVLWRIEESEILAYPVVLVQSDSEPDWAKIKVLDYFIRPPVYKKLSFIDNIENGIQLRFRLHANPVVTKHAEDKEKIIKVKNNKEIQEFRNRRTSILNNEMLYEWLVKQGTIMKGRQTGGFQILSASITKSEKYKIKKHKNGSEFFLFGITFEGVLKVTDTEYFKRTISNGIGKGKAFGMGLFSVGPAR